MLIALVACSNENNECVHFDKMHTVRMYFDGGLSTYADAASRAVLNLPDGAEFYVKFSSAASGSAVYHKSENEWSLTYNGNLASGSGTCSLYYIEQPKSVSGTIVSLSSNSVVYGCTNGSYTISSDGSITVTATLNPLLSRVRFAGTSGMQITVSGMKRYTTFDLGSYSFGKEMTDNVSVTVGTDGFSPYLYYAEPYGQDLTVVNGSNTFATDNPLKAGGTTGYITVPTKSTHSGWSMDGEEPDSPTIIGSFIFGGFDNDQKWN